jgi:hypothetical protein
VACLHMLTAGTAAPFCSGARQRSSFTFMTKRQRFEPKTRLEPFASVQNVLSTLWLPKGTPHRERIPHVSRSEMKNDNGKSIYIFEMAPTNCVRRL